MDMTNPFSVWYDNPSHQGVRGSNYDEPPPSVFGALPVFSPNATNSPMLTYTFTSFNPSILNCTILGPGNTPSFNVFTDPAMPGYTIFKTPDGKSFGLLEWSQASKVEIRGAVAKQLASQFLRRSTDCRFRVMQVGGQDYMLLSGPQGTVTLYPAGVNANNNSRVAQIKCRGPNVVLEIDQNVARAGFLHACIVATVLLYSGHTI
ncbi:hypothetical protein E1B28_002508 [Marasmius oreades]|uniref:Uncharacterized protein n=1 Tax=Marasmius oreades TaxID=181124 RepID=A0A9P7RNS5_9AGAR|nr:uncharacterized protein E1B28_002508 [Marasmius oreades]KAG7086560.1 hypothetical protein E1B28_002508 [Marasmius oreades]